jgi:tetratricopeptide (TPR) repeat protein/capsular polysaccharide biosynthesis protein
MSDALQALEQGRTDEAEALATAQLAADPVNAQAASILGAVALRRGRLDEAVRWLEQARAWGGADAMLFANCGEAYRRVKRFDEAFDCFERSMRLYNGDAMVFCNMGRLMHDRGQARYAEHFFRSALQLNERLASAMFALAELYRDEGHWSEALVEYARGLEVVSGDAHWHARLGTLRQAQGDAPGAADALSRALALDPHESAYALDLSRAQFELCREAEAEASLARGLELSGRPPAGRRVLSARYQSTRAWCEQTGVDYVKLSGEYHLNLQPLQTLPAQAAPHFIPDVPVAPEAFRLRAPGLEVLPGDFALLTPERRFLVQGLVSLPHQYPHTGRHAHHSSDDGRVLLHIPGERMQIDEPCAILGGSGDHFAWMFEALPRLWALEQAPAVDPPRLIVPAALAPEREAMLAAMGIDRQRLVYLPDDRTLMAPELHVASLLNVGYWVSPVALQFVRRLYRGSPAATARRVYLTRRGLPGSQLANEADLLPALERHGFEVVALDGLDALAIMAVLREAEAVLTLDGEWLANLPVAPQGALVGAIVPNGVYGTRSHFVASQLGLRFVYLVGEALFDTGAAIEQCDVQLAPELLQQFLQRLRQERS